MKQISADFRKGYAKVRVENADDLWFLSQVIDEGDLVSGKTLRKLKLGGEEERKTKIVRKPVYIKIRVEKAEFGESQTNLRVLGRIEEGPEDIARGEHHTFNIEEGTEIKIEKTKWLNYQKDKLKEAFSQKSAKILLVVFDREDAYFALMKRYGYEVFGHIEGNVTKKDVDEGKISNFYVEIIDNIREYDKRYKLDHIILASPAFWKDELLKNLNDETLKSKMVMATCSSVGKSAFNEVLKRDEVRNVLSADRITKEINLVEGLMKGISDNGKAAYGMIETENAANSGAIEILLVSESLIQKLRAKNKFSKIDNIMKIVDSMNAKVHIISSKHEGGTKLDGLGGIGAILRYKLSY
ncbi:MAG: mRNA surveillance protein pelota [Nanoarchaeota archaeon]|nr:mRNA surveillance protein pelota [Nanoarchaeota archaeon]